MKNRIFFVLLFPFLFGYPQTSAYVQQNFCNSLKKVFELGIKDNFDSYDGTLVKQSPFLQVPGYSIKLEGFPVNYADKDHRFVAKTNLNLDSLSAINKLEEMKLFVGNCLDSTTWSRWSDANGDDSTTVFFKELKESVSTSKEFNLTLAVVSVATKVYSINLYVHRRR
jgi:hypothetical protein